MWLNLLVKTTHTFANVYSASLQKKIILNVFNLWALIRFLQFSSGLCIVYEASKSSTRVTKSTNTNVIALFYGNKINPRPFSFGFFVTCYDVALQHIVSLHFRAIQRTLWSKTINQARKCFVSYYSSRWDDELKKDEWNTMIFPMEPTTNDWCQRFEQFWNEEIQPSRYL